MKQLSNVKPANTRYYVPKSKSYFRVSKQAFTLAEVLITLGIVGVVAAMTLPTLITKYQKKVTVTQLKKAYTEISQAIKQSEQQNGEISYWDFTLSGTDFYNTYLKNYFIKNKEIQNSEFKQKYTLLNLNGTTCTDEVWCTQSSTLYVYLNNGSIMGIMTHGSNNTNSVYYKSITIDVNGLKGPNTVGKDFFVFSLYNKKGLVPYGYNYAGTTDNSFDVLDRSTIISSSYDYACNKLQKGIFCTALIMYDGWEIKDDYPW